MATKTIAGRIPKYAGAALSFLLSHSDESLEPTSETVEYVYLDSEGAFSFTVTSITRGTYDVIVSDIHGTLGFVGRVHIPLDMPGTYLIGATTTAEADSKRNEIASIDSVLSSGVSSVTVDGTTTHYDLDSLRRRKRELQHALSKLSAHESMRRPVASSIYLGGF